MAHGPSYQNLKAILPPSFATRLHAPSTVPSGDTTFVVVRNGWCSPPASTLDRASVSSSFSGTA
eukprot:scaffold7789_cov200-Pinguiococcus_pyrenoidosus.AAC.5